MAKSTRIVPLRSLSTVRTSARPFRPFMRRVTPDTVTEQTFPEVAISKPCTRKGPAKKLRDCHIELAFLGPERAKESGVAPGAYLRACTKYGKPGRLIPVKDHHEAATVSADYCACRLTSSAEACASAAAGPAPKRRR